MRPTVYIGRAPSMTRAITACSEEPCEDRIPTSAPPLARDVTGTGDITASVARFHVLLDVPRDARADGPSTFDPAEAGWEGLPIELNSEDGIVPAAVIDLTTGLGALCSELQPLP